MSLCWWKDNRYYSNRPTDMAILLEELNMYHKMSQYHNLVLQPQNVIWIGELHQITCHDSGDTFTLNKRLWSLSAWNLTVTSGAGWHQVILTSQLRTELSLSLCGTDPLFPCSMLASVAVVTAFVKLDVAFCPIKPIRCDKMNYRDSWWRKTSDLWEKASMLTNQRSFLIVDEACISSVFP